MSRCTAWTHSSALPTDRRWCPGVLLEPTTDRRWCPGALLEPTTDRRWYRGALLEPMTDRRWSWFVGSKADEERRLSFVCSIVVVQRGSATMRDSNRILLLCETVTAAVAVLLWCMPLWQTVLTDTRSTVRHNTSVLHSAVLHVSAHQNPFITTVSKRKYICNVQMYFRQWHSQIYDYLLQLFITILVSCL